MAKSCHLKYNPYKCDALTKVNSQICEQSFNFFNKFTQCKSMNEYRFRLFFVYAIDLHNLKFNGLLNSSHPRIAAQSCKDMENDIAAALEDLKLVTEKDEVMKEEHTKRLITCDFCGKSFLSKSGLTRHINAVHQDGSVQQKNLFECEICGKTLLSKSGMTRHINSTHQTNQTRQNKSPK